MNRILVSGYGGNVDSLDFEVESEDESEDEE